MGFKIADAYVQIKEKGGKQTTSMIARIGSSMRRMGAMAGVGAAAAGTALLALAKSAAATGDDFHKMALRTGASTEALSELAFAAEQSGSDIDTVERGFKGMARTLLNADRGLSTATDSLSMLGLDISQLQGLKPEDQFAMIAQAISEVPDATTRAGLAMQIFGKAGSDLGPLLQEGAAGIAKLRQEASSLGRTVTQEEANKAAAFTDSLNRLISVASGVGRKIGAAVIPYLTNIMDTAQFVFDNWDVLLAIAGENVKLFTSNGIEYIKTWATNAVELVQWFGGNWRDILVDMGNITMTVMKNIATNTQSVIQKAQNKIAEYILRTQAYWSGTSQEALQDQLDTLNEMSKPIDMKGLLDGFKTQVKELPKLTEANIKQTTDRLQSLYDQIKLDAPAVNTDIQSQADTADNVAESAKNMSEQLKAASSFDASGLVNNLQQAISAASGDAPGGSSVMSQLSKRDRQALTNAQNRFVEMKSNDRGKFEQRREKEVQRTNELLLTIINNGLKTNSGPATAG